MKPGELRARATLVAVCLVALAVILATSSCQAGTYDGKPIEIDGWFVFLVFVLWAVFS